MRTKILNELKESYSAYAPFWDEWKEYKFNGLSPTDIYVLEIQINNDFVIGIEDFIMFYNNLDRLKNLTAKLTECYIEFQDWLIIRFQLSIVKLSFEIPLDLFFRIPLIEFNKCKQISKVLSAELINTVTKFNCNSISEIFQSYSDKDFRSEEKFAIVLEFQTILEIERIIHQSLRKEVTKSKQYCTLN